MNAVENVEQIPVLHRDDLARVLRTAAEAIESGEVEANGIVIVSRNRYVVGVPDGLDEHHSHIRVWSTGEGADFVDDVIGLLEAGKMSLRG